MSAETRFDWSATEGAPKNYPMEIISGYLRYHGGGGGVSVPSGAMLFRGWGMGRTTTSGGVGPVPDKLEITFFSYLEDAFYQGSFELPHEKILRIFQQEDSKPKKKNREGDDIPVYYRMVVGVAPGGVVAVWASAGGNKEVFFGQAKKVEMDFAEALDVSFITDRAGRAQYVTQIVDETLPSEFVAGIRKHGIPFKTWANYRTQYQWMPAFAVSHPPQRFSMAFYNGEGATFYHPYEPEFSATTHPIPKRMRFGYAVNGQGIEYLYFIDFDEKEMFDAYAKLAAKQLPLQLEVAPTVPIEHTQVRLHNTKEAIVLKKFTIENID